MREWEESRRLHELFELAGPVLGARKLRLFACACCRRIPPGACPPGGVRAVEAAERFADGLADAFELALAEQAAFEAHVEERDRPAGEWSRQAEMASRALALAAAPGLYQALDAAEFARKALPHAPGEAWLVEAVEEEVQVALLRDVAGPTPSRPAEVSAWLRGGEAGRLAVAAYGGEWGLLPILADALEEAGCADTDVLAHLRWPGPHVRGCWALDLVLGKG